MLSVWIERTEVSQPKIYPWVGIHIEDSNRRDPFIVYFVRKDVGIVISANDKQNVVPFDPDYISWAEEQFVPFFGEIKLVSTL